MIIHPDFLVSTQAKEGFGVSPQGIQGLSRRLQAAGPLQIRQGMGFGSAATPAELEDFPCDSYQISELRACLPQFA